ncbi:MAG: NAD(P)-dependent oxidoreductase [Nitrospirae bacterium]|nr:NAD(P)-dependent oxidoreductase [Nitrospirota bacterium]
MKKVLLTGASGFVGRHSIPFLLNKGYKVHAVFHKGKIDVIKNENLFWHQCDLLNPLEQEQLFTKVKPTYLLHFAWYAVPGKYWTSNKNLAWEEASINLIKRFYENDGQRMVAAGTCAEYAWDSGVLSEDRTPLKPKTIYGRCKSRVGSFLEKYSKEIGASSAWGRIFFLYGPYEDPRRLVPSVICSLLKNKPALCTHGEQVRDFLFVKDVASAFVGLLESDVAGSVNVASGQPVALKDIIYKIAEKLGRRDLVQLGALPTKDNEPKLLIADIRKLAEKARWQPKFDLNTGLELTIKWWKNKLYV